MSVDSGIIAVFISSGLALAATVFTGVRTTKVEKRSYALQEMESSLKYRAEDINSMLSRLKLMEDKVSELETKLEEAEKERTALRKQNADDLLRINALDIELATARTERERLVRESQQLIADRQRLEELVTSLRRE